MAFQGEIIDGKYEILREIGRGGMSVVYLAMDKRLNKQWAIKEFRKDKDDESKQLALESLLKEANLMKKLDHPTLPRIVDIIDDSQTVYIVMDYIEGESLNKVLDAYGAQPQEAVIEWAKQLSEVLDYLHTRVPPVIYRDMKPANIMLKPDGTIRLIDFGIAREYKEGKAGDTTSIGTRGYAAPEQFGDKGQTDARTDIYSLGVTLYHLVTGKNPAEPPYEIYPIRHWNPNLSSGLEWLIQKSTQLNPKDRFQSCAEVTYVLENLEQFDGAYKKSLRKKLNWFIASVSCTLVFAIVSGSAVFLQNADHNTQLEHYKSQHTISGYIDAIQYDNTDTESYMELLNLINSDIYAIVSGELEDSEDADDLHSEGKIREGEIAKVIHSDNLEALKKEDVNSYVKVNYNYGLLLWNKFTSDEKSDGSENKAGLDEAIKASNPYFENVIDTVIEENDNCGLTDDEYHTTQYYYLLGYFKKNEHLMEYTDKGKFTVNSTVKNMNFPEITINEDDDSLENPYNAYWEVVKRLTIDLETYSKMPESVKMNTLYIATNTVSRKCSKFLSSGTVSMLDGGEVSSFFNTAVSQVLEIEAGIDKNDDSINTQRMIERTEQTKESLKSLREDLSDRYKKAGKTIDLAEIE